MIHATQDRELVNSFINHPEIMPFIGYDPAFGYVDIAAAIYARDFLYLTNGDDALMVLQGDGFGHWEKHSLHKPTCRGRRAIDTGKSMLAEMQCRGAKTVWSQTPTINRRARWFNRQIGMRPEGDGVHAVVGPVQYFFREFETCH
jgi:hypothetical protein